MKYLYNNLKFTKEDNIDGFRSPLTYYLDIPILSFTNHVKIKSGTIDLVTSKEYDMPIQLGSVILRDFYMFKEKVDWDVNRNTCTFIKVNLQLIFVEDRYNPIKYILKDVKFNYIRVENLEFFLNTIIPLLNWGISKHKEIDLILLFSILLCKKTILSDKKDFNYQCPYMSKYFLDDLTVKQNFEFRSRVGRDDHAYEYTHLIFSSKIIEEYYFIKLLGKELAEGNCFPPITIKKEDDLVEISYHSMFDNNAIYEPSRDYTPEECNAYKKKLIEKHAELYNLFWERFLSLFEEYSSSKAKEQNSYKILSIYDPI